MPTSIVKTIGTASRDYTTIQAWEDACPVDLVAVDQTYTGTLYNDSEFVLSAQLLISGVTTDATRFVTLKCGTGQSFYDHSTKTTNPLRYNQSNGAAVFLASPFSSDSFVISTPFTIVDGIQFKNTGTSQAYSIRATGASVKIKNCLTFRGSAYGNNTAIYGAENSTNEFTNCIAIDEAAAGIGFQSAGGGTIIACTAIKVGGGAGGAFNGNYGINLIRNCLSLGFASFNRSGSFTAGGSDYNASDLAGTGTDALAGSHCIKNLVVANTIVSFAAGTSLDARIKAGASVIGAGLRDQTYTADLDIIKQARSITTPTIGAWEVVSAGGSTSYSYTAAGGYVLSGVSTNIRGRPRTASGGLQTGGASIIARGVSRSTSGGMTFAGTGSTSRGLLRLAIGGLNYLGTSGVSFFSATKSLVVVALGGLTFGGVTNIARKTIKAVSGGLLFGGSSSIVLTPDPNPITSRAFKRGRRPRTRKNY